MKILLPFLVVLASCGTVHKVIQKENKKVDSVASVTRDTSFKSTKITHTDDLDVKDVDITVFFNDDLAPHDYTDSAIKPIPPPQAHRMPTKLAGYAQLINDAVASTGRSGNISSIKIHIGSISDSTRHTESTDTGSAHVKTDIHVKTEDKTIDKKIDRSGWPWYIWLILAGVLIAMAWIILRRFKIL